MRKQGPKEEVEGIRVATNPWWHQRQHLGERRENVQIVMHNPMFNPIAKKEPLAITGSSSGASGYITRLSRDIVVQSL